MNTAGAAQFLIKEKQRMVTRSQIGVLDYVAEFGLQDESVVTDPLIGLDWHIRRTGVREYKDAMRHDLVNLPIIKEALSVVSKRATADQLRHLAGIDDDVERGLQESDIESITQAVSQKESFVEALAAGGELGGARAVAEHLVFNITRGGRAVKHLESRCADGHKWFKHPVCPECSKSPSAEEWVDVSYSPDLAMKIWEDTSTVSDELAEKVLPGSRERCLGTLLYGWVTEECAKLEARSVFVKQSLEKN